MILVPENDEARGYSAKAAAQLLYSHLGSIVGIIENRHGLINEQNFKDITYLLTRASYCYARLEELSKKDENEKD